MTGEFSIEVDETRDLVRIRMAGFFDGETIAAFLEARRAAHARLRCGRNAHLTLNDVRAMKIQSHMTIDSFQAILADPEYRSRRLAFVAPMNLARGKLLRALAGRDARCFDDAATAETWLLGQDEEPLRKAG
ncbi:MAG: hypothetical protein ACT4OE_08910 [Sphingosinicella sp.]